MGSTQGTVQTISDVGTAIDTMFPMILAMLRLFNPTLAAEAAIIQPVISQGVKAVGTIVGNTGASTNDAVAQVVAHNTPGQPNAPALAPNADTGDSANPNNPRT